MRLFLISGLLALAGFGCTSKKYTAHQPLNAANLRAVLPDSNETAALDGRSLAHVYCSACHLFPEPALLPKAIWEKNVLPAMGQRLGLGNDLGLYRNIPPQDIAALLRADIYPDKALITKKDWLKIRAYYQTQAPDSLARPPLIPVSKLTHFKIYPLPLNQGRYALTTLVKYEPATHELFIGDQRNKLFRFNRRLQSVDSIQLDTPPVAVQRSGPGQYRVLTIGSMQPADSPYGRLYRWQPSQANQVVVTPQLTGLPRPVQLAAADLNQDQREDLIICHYGNQLGKLSWYESKPDGRYQEHVLQAWPGSRQVIIQDLNQDQRPDLVVLFAQAAESVVVFYNQGNGHFTTEKIIQLPPVYGASYLELADFNQDGAWDILLTNGDNADLSVILKPYHGVRLYLNNKRNAFREARFLPLPGATKAVARDFDQDGDLDIAAIAFFPDYEKQPAAGFIYYENQGRNAFVAQTMSQATAGRWLTLDAGDVDQDGDEDIMLGSFIFAATPVPPALQNRWAQQGPSILILENQRLNQLQ